MKMKSKKLDEYNARKILYSNKNLFKENDYELRGDMEFEEKNEITCQKICFYRGVPILAVYIIYKFFFIFISCFFHNDVGYFNILKIVLFTSLIKSSKIKNINKSIILKILKYPTSLLKKQLINTNKNL